MNQIAPPVPPAIECGVKFLNSVPGCELTDGVRFIPSTGEWMVPVALNLGQGCTSVPKRTKWCVLMEGVYPQGSIKVFPAASGGLTATFPHQDRNVLRPGHLGWRMGKLCLDNPLGDERGVVHVRDPWGDAESRIRWHIERALVWLKAAVEGRLMAAGDPFETPMQPSSSPSKNTATLVVHNETLGSYDAWEEWIGQQGIVEFHSLESHPRHLFANFLTPNGDPINLWTGREGTLADPVVLGNWWLWPSPIVVPPYHSPGTWGELRRAGLEVGINVDTFLADFAPKLRGNSSETVLLLGYPMPSRVGQQPSEIHWNALLMPRIPEAPPKLVGNGPRKMKKGFKAQKPPKGFRMNSRGLWQRDYTRRFWDGADLRMIRTENWSGERLQARGRLPAPILNSRVAIVGVGALGSVVAEMLVRAGIREITLIDDDLVIAGNVCRHVLTLKDMYKPKVDALATRLEEISPLVKVYKHSTELPGMTDGLFELLEPQDIVVDCTASNTVPSLLATVWWPIPRLFVSFSLGYEGRRLFSFGEFGNTFSEQLFNQYMNPWLEKEAIHWAASGEVLEGVGCWSPLFPARIDDVFLAAAFCLKELVRLAQSRPHAAQFRVYCQSGSAGQIESFALEPPCKADET